MNFSMHLSARRVSRWLVAPAVALLVATGCGKESSGSEDSATVVEFGNRQYGDASSSPLTKYFGYDDTNQATGTIADLPPRQGPLFDKDSNVKSIHRNKN